MMLRMFGTGTLLAAAALVLGGCLDSGQHIVSLHIDAETLQDGEIAITKYSGTNLIGVYGIDGNGKRVRLTYGLNWAVTDPRLVFVQPLGEAALCIGLADWFDTPLAPEPPPLNPNDAQTPMPDAALDEPDAAMTALDADAGDDEDDHADNLPREPFEPGVKLAVAYRGRTTAVRVVVVPNLAGTWRIRLDRAPDQPFAEITLRQQGRTVTDALIGVTGEIRDNRITLDYGGAITLEGTLLSRDLAAGSAEGIGGWTAERRFTGSR